MEKPATPEYFCKQRKSRDGLSYTCKDCDKEYRKQKKAKNKKKKFIYDDKKVKECNECGEEKPATPDYFNRDIKMKDGLPNTCKECVKKKSQKHYQENKEEKREYNRKYYQENKEWHREYLVTYRLENPEVNRLHKQRRRARMAQLPHDLTLDEWEDTLEYFDYSCAYCGVSDDNLGKEHVIPIVKGGGYTVDNIIPACQSCNSSKHTTDLEEWYVSYEHYDEDRLNKILDYVKIMEEI